MPDVTRSDSSRSDVSRPRVSFNRNVHVKRINGPNTANAYSLSSDGTSLIPTSIRRERPRTKKEMNKEAEVVLKQVDKVSCKATTNVKLEEDKTKPNKKKSFSFLKKNDKPERAKYSSSDVDSGSSQEFRIYRINGPADENHVLHSSNTNKAHNDEGNTKNKNKINGKKSYDFMSLDRKRLKKEKKNKTLDYLSLEKNNEVLEKMKKKNSGKTLMSMVFEKMENKNKKATVSLSPAIFAEEKENIKSQIKISEGSEEKMGKKKQLSPIIESPGVDYFNRKRESNVDKMIKRLTEKTPSKLTRNTGKMGMKEQQNTICHNDNKPFSYTNGEKNDLGLKLESKNVEGLGDSKEDLKSTSPTGDVIYAQVIVGGRDGNAQQTTVYKRVASNEVGRVFVGEESNQFQVGSNYKTNANQDDGICERVSVISEDILKKENLEGFKMPSYELFADNRGHGESYHKKSSESDHASPNPARDEYTTVIKVAPKYDVNKASDKSPTDLHDLSIRREILLSRSESQAKERFNSIKRLQEPARTKRHVPNLNGVRQNEKPMKSEIKYVPDDTRVSEKNTTSIKKTPKEVEVTDSTLRKKRESKLDLYLKEKEEKWKNSDKVHVIKTDDYENILRKLSRLGKSKSFIQEKPKNKRMEKMKMLFKKKKESKSSESEEDPLAARYTEYRGSDIELSDRSTDSSPKRTIARTEAAPLKSSYSRRKPFAAPTSYDSTGTLIRNKNVKNNDPSWMKPSDKYEKLGHHRKLDDASSETTNFSKPTNLRFFGDTDLESTTNEYNSPDLKLKYDLHRSGKFTDSDEDPIIISCRPESRMTDSTLKGSSTGKSKSKYDLDKPDYGLKQMNHGLHMTSNKFENYASNLSESSTLKNETFDINGVKYGARVTRSASSLTNSMKSKEKLRNLKSTPAITVTSPDESLSRKVKSQGNLYSQDDKKGGRKFYDSSAESATEGDSSQHSSKSMIYLHAATVGDIPGPRNIYKSQRRSQSREELSSIGDNSATFLPGKKTLSRSISVLAPWRPKHSKEDRTLHYDLVDYSKGKPPTGFGKNKRSSSRERKSNELKFNTIGKENRRRKDLLR